MICSDLVCFKLRGFHQIPNCRRERYAAYAVHRPGEPGGHVAGIAITIHKGHLLLGNSSRTAIHTPIGRKPVLSFGHWEPWSRHIRRYLTQRSLWRDFLSHKSTYHFQPLCLSWVGIASTCNYGVNPFHFFLYLTTGLCVWSSPALRWGTSTAISASVWAFTSSPKSPSDTRREGNRCWKKANRPIVGKDRISEMDQVQVEVKITYVGSYILFGLFFPASIYTSRRLTNHVA